MTYGGARSLVTAAGSPHTYQNLSPQRQEVVISGGTVLAIDLSRDGAAFDPIGTLAAHCVLNPNDRIRVTYLIAPTIAVYPL